MMENKGKVGTVENTLPDQVLDYYKFYSQNNKLPQYFCGTTDEAIAHKEKDQDQPSTSTEVTKPQANIPTITIDLVENQCRNPSPTSSIASNRKLEWDNGADIGYQNCLHKSISLPALNVTQKGENLCITHKYSSSEEDDNISIRIYKSSPIIKQTSSQNTSNETSSDSFGGINLVTKIGIPAAESTPFNKEKLAKSDPGCSYSVTSQVSSNILGKLLGSKSDEVINIDTKFGGGDVEDASKNTLQGQITSDLRNVLILFKNTDDSINMEPDKSLTKFELKPKKPKDLHITTFNYELSGSEPTLKEDVNEPYTNLNSSEVQAPKKNQNVSSLTNQNQDLNRNNKNIILTLSKPTYVECIDPIIKNDKNIQTNSESASVGTQVEMKSTTTSSSNNQSIKYIFHDYKDFSNSSTTQTGSDDVVSNCNSFEYLYGSACEQNSKKSTVSTSTGDNSKSNTTENGSVNILKRASVKIDLSNLTSSSTSSNENYLTGLLSTNDSQKHDLNKNLGILQKLLNSKRYNEETKQYYVKKILKSIVKNYFNDSSSLSSEKITPNIDDKLPQRTKYIQEEKSCGVIPSTYETMTGAKQSDFASKQVSTSDLKNNVPWFPSPKQAQSNKVIGSRNKTIFSQQNQEQVYQNEQCNYSNVNPSSLDYCTPHTLSSNGTNNSSKLKANNWKKEQTISEIRFGQRNNGRGDSPNINNNEILCFAQQERQHQLHWINNEIEHLTKLRQLLEDSKKAKNTIVDRKSSTENNVKKTTSVYMITTETVGNNVNKHNNINNLKNCEITKVKGSSDINYKVEDNKKATNYRFSEISNFTLPHKINIKPNSAHLKIDKAAPVGISETSKNAGKVAVTSKECNINLIDQQELLSRHLESGNKETSEIVNKVENGNSTIKNDAEYPISSNNEAMSTQIKTNNSNERPYSREKNTLRSSSDNLYYEAKYQSNRGSKQTKTNEQTFATNNENKDCSVILERNSSRPSRSISSPSSDKRRTSASSKYESSRTPSSNNGYSKKSSKKTKNDGEQTFTLRCSCPDKGPCKKSSENEQCFNNAVVISSTVTPSVTNPKDNVRRLVIEVPISDDEDVIMKERVPSSTSSDSVLSNISEKPKSKSKVKLNDRTSKLSSSKDNEDTTNRKSSKDMNKNSEKPKSKSKVKLNDRTSKLSSSKDNEDTSRRKSSKDMSKNSEHINKDTSNRVSSERTSHDRSNRRSSEPMSEDSNKDTSSSSASTTSSSTTSSSESLVLCSCCKCIVNDAVYGGRSDNMQQSFTFQSQQQPFCNPCYKENKNRNWNMANSFFTSQHTCRCNMESNAAAKIRETLQELKELDLHEKYYKKQSKKSDSHSIDKGTCVNKPIAYLLTFEQGDNYDYKEPEVVRSIEEVRIKIPFTRDVQKTVESIEKETRQKKHKKEKHKTITRNVQESVENIDKETKQKNHKKEKHKSRKSLQDYLQHNRPSFIKAAEERRKCMIELAIMRERRCAKYKQLLALTNGIPMQNLYSENHHKRIFTTKEMKSITAKKYNKLPEVQQKLLDDREKQIKKANRMLADIFNKKLQANVLRGNPTVSTSVSVLNFS